MFKKFILSAVFTLGVAGMALAGTGEEAVKESADKKAVAPKICVTVNLSCGTFLACSDTFTAANDLADEMRSNESAYCN